MKRLTNKTKNNLRQVRHARVRAKVIGTAECPRLSVFRSLRGMVVQLIDDSTGKTLCYVDTKSVKNGVVEGRTAKTAAGFLLGKLLAEKAKSLGVNQAVFDRAGYKYHGRVAAVADGARDGGLKI